MSKTIMNRDQMSRTLERLASEIFERRGGEGKCALIGIQRRGADIAERLRPRLAELFGHPVPLGKLDINLYRDDWTHLEIQPRINCTEIPFDLEDMNVILVDDVLFSGRTVRSALEAILDYGRPRRVELLVLVDRGHRELPIQADYAGRIIATSASERVNVLVDERDGEDKVEIS